MLLVNDGQLWRRNSQVRNLWPPHFRTFCELVEGKENKLTTFSTWTIMFGYNESNVCSPSPPLAHKKYESVVAINFLLVNFFSRVAQVCRDAAEK